MVVSSETPRHSFDDLVEDEGISGVNFLEEILDDFLLMAFAGRVHPIVAFFEFIAFVQKERHVAAVIDDELRAFSFAVEDRLPRAVPVFLERFALPGEDRHAGFGDGRGGVILRRENVAARPAHSGAKLDERLDEHRRLDGHVERPRDPDARERLVRRVFFANGHQARAFPSRRSKFPCVPNRQERCHGL